MSYREVEEEHKLMFILLILLIDFQCAISKDGDLFCVFSQNLSMNQSTLSGQQSFEMN